MSPFPGRTRRRLAPEKAGDVQAAGAAAVALLGRRDFSSAELAAKLAEQGFLAEAVQGAVAELVERGFVNDARYLQQFVSYHAARGQGPARIRQQLKALALDADEVEAALAEGPDWRALAREVRIRKFGLEVPEDWTERARQARFLQYRGFSTDQIRAALGPEFDSDSA